MHIGVQLVRCEIETSSRVTVAHVATIRNIKHGGVLIVVVLGFGTIDFVRLLKIVSSR